MVNQINNYKIGKDLWISLFSERTILQIMNFRK